MTTTPNTNAQAAPAAGEQAGAVAKWIDVRDHLPESGVEVLTRYRHPGGEWDVGIHRYHPEDIGTPGDFGNSGWLYGSAGNVETSHWMPTPSTNLAAPGAAIAAREQEAYSDMPEGDLSKVWKAVDDVCDWLDYTVWPPETSGLEKSVKNLNNERLRAHIRAARATKGDKE